jgi:hypothetical protein
MDRKKMENITIADFFFGRKVSHFGFASIINFLMEIRVNVVAKKEIL